MSGRREQTSPRRGLLEGITVADFGWAVAGPVLSRFMAYHGATVIKIESNTRLDNTRIAPPFQGKPGRNNSGYFALHNASKRSVTLNLKTDEGRRIAKKLALAADVVNENFVPGVLDKAGLDYETLSRERPDLVMMSSSAQGQTGPHAQHPGLGVTLQGLVGLSHLTGWPDREPVGTGEPYTDTLVVGMAGAALMAALDWRRRTGRGLHVDLAQFETVAHILAPAILHEQLTGTRHARLGNASLARAPEGVFPCKGEERWIAISIEDDRQWKTLAGLIGFPRDAAPQDLPWRFTHREDIDARIAAWTAGRDVFELERLLQGVGIPAHSVASGEDVVNDPQLAARTHGVEREHPTMGRYTFSMPPFRLSEHALEVERSPLIGEHTEEVLRNVLNLSDDELAHARQSGALD